MNLYLDDDTADRRLVAILLNGGHDVTVPQDVDHSGSTDPRHLVYAIEEDMVLVTRNHDDFLDLHEVIRAAGGTYPGLLIIRSDNDPKRDMTPRGIANAIGKLEGSGVPIRNEVYILNHWR